MNFCLLMNYFDLNIQMNDYRAIAEYEALMRRQIEDSWNPQQEDVLKAWAEKASGWAWLHDKSSRFYNTTSNIFTYSSVILSTISGGIGFMMGDMANEKSNDSSEGFDRRWLTFSVGCMNIISAALTSFQKFTRCSEKAEMHSQMNKQFSSYCRKIVLELALQACDRRNCIEFCKLCRDEYDRLVENSPQIPSRTIRKFNVKFKADHVPEVANGLVHFVQRRNVQIQVTPSLAQLDASVSPATERV